MTASKTWFISGSSRGLGRALTEAALAAGNRVVASARDTVPLEPLRERFGERLRLAKLDVTDDAAAQAAIGLAVEAYGDIDVVVNNAGYGELGSVEDTGLASFRQQIEVNLIGTIIVTKAAIPVLRRQRRGHIVQVSSVGGRIGAPARAAYSAAKWGVEGFSESLAREMALIGVHVTIVEPGGFRTGFAQTAHATGEGRAEYDVVVGAAVRMQRDYDGRQPGDPAKAAAVLLKLVEMDRPPLRIALGSDAVNAISATDRQRLEELESWRALSVSTDY
ncbi:MULTISPECIES: SDR family NAD(P)-dependent oxidoreductase [Bradyrhizobium]|jgi:NAD(P)-dependent dehydrogenase (short-subunit alcohol dehydrogenase family)|uniref:SDR family NAD(P)-dependent oxidoreductase n=2 Tax=Bradyrhizobium symbiodeficiens TaxID=1404367 RepID=A0A2U8Q558_9BRAD|nr:MULTISPECIES: SDR family NAD(P)-dependent oxidoreductase [Bradyrhizobium]AWM05151.1 KR domain-containing protein [Bradyrhizobium symbiodeficiens]QIP04091.1 SDR family NAD(P)-dependent oxidoreductase [Bradyrhizobium symbiodeficiens]QIP06252.1 SDR family NAD(P)-dependent oxidoreductase [Bradyrhizobium symbiodeficiens]UPJ58199.1 SDR family NAD(P)-dependent oxidoreductase [Bradyrhizobium sp. 192]